MFRQNVLEGMLADPAVRREQGHGRLEVARLPGRPDAPRRQLPRLHLQRASRTRTRTSRCRCRRPTRRRASRPAPARTGSETSGNAPRTRRREGSSHGEQEGRRRHRRRRLGRRDHGRRADESGARRASGSSAAHTRSDRGLRRTTTTSCATRSATSCSRTPPNETWTLRHDAGRERRCPCASSAHSCPGTGVGGAGVHWNGQTWRFHPRDFTMYTSTVDALRQVGDPRRA